MQQLIYDIDNKYSESWQQPLNMGVQTTEANLRLRKKLAEHALAAWHLSDYQTLVGNPHLL